MRQGFLQYLPVGAAVGLVLLLELVLVVGTFAVAPDAPPAAAPAPALGDVSNTEALGDLLYTRYVFLFQTAGMILLVAMIGAIVLTHRVRSGVRKQSINAQVGRTRASAVELKKVTPGSGLG
jgi:NADH-quinone oxidoreductase subunit J